MQFDFEKPTLTDPYVENGEHKWCESKEKGVLYFWTQRVVTEVQLNPMLDPDVVDLGHGTKLTVFKGLSRQELLYRLYFKNKPNRFLIKPAPYTIFWSYGKEGGASKTVKYLFKDKNLSIHEWVDKKSFLADLRYVHYSTNDYTFWSR